MRVLLIEDEIPAINRLKKLLKELQPTWQVVGEIDEVRTAINWLGSNPHPDLIFMDIQLADGYSFEIFDQTQITAPVIFITAYDQYAVNAFRVKGLDYILKPIQKKLLIESIDRFAALSQPEPINFEEIAAMFQSKTTSFKERFLIKSGDELNFVRTSEIAYFISESSYTFIVTKQGSRYIIDQTLDQIDARLDPALFFRINRGQIVGLDSIGKISAYFNNRLKLDLTPTENGDTIVSRSRVKPFKEWLNQ